MKQQRIISSLLMSLGLATSLVANDHIVVLDSQSDGVDRLLVVNSDKPTTVNQVKLGMNTQLISGTNGIRSYVSTENRSDETHVRSGRLVDVNLQSGESSVIAENADFPEWPGLPPQSQVVLSSDGTRFFALKRRTFGINKDAFWISTFDLKSHSWLPGTVPFLTCTGAQLLTPKNGPDLVLVCGGERTVHSIHINDKGQATTLESQRMQGSSTIKNVNNGLAFSGVMPDGHSLTIISRDGGLIKLDSTSGTIIFENPKQTQKVVESRGLYVATSAGCITPDGKHLFVLGNEIGDATDRNRFLLVYNLAEGVLETVHKLQVPLWALALSPEKEVIWNCTVVRRGEDVRSRRRK